MNEISQKRRTLLKGTLAIGATSSLIGTGLVHTHPIERPAWPKDAFNANTVKEGLMELTGNDKVIPSPDDILIKAPTIAEKGIAHITIQSHIPDTESITIFIPNNSSPLVANFILNQKVSNTITTRIKIEDSGDIVAVIKASNMLYSATKKMRTPAAK